MVRVFKNDKSIMMRRVLIVGGLADDKWIGNLIRKIKDAKPSIQIDFFWNDYASATPCENSVYCDNIYNIDFHFPRFLYRFPKIRGKLKKRDVSSSFEDFLNKQIENGIWYDCVNFHYLKNETLCCWERVKRLTNQSLLMPWGSDVLRRSKIYLKRMSRYIQHYDYIGTSDNPRFKKELISKLAVKEEQFVDLDFGSESIDRLMDSEHISRTIAKESLGLKDKFVITIGYNAHKEQHHIEVIDAIANIKEKLPHNTLLVFPMTYGGKQQVKDVEQKVQLLGLDYKIYDQYLSYQDIVNLRKCSDVFIHAQMTDSNSASLAEYLFCRSIVINAAWLKYEHFEQFGMPYFTFNDFSELPQVIEKAIINGSLVKDELVEYLKQYSWRYKVPKWLALYNGKQINSTKD